MKFFLIALTVASATLTHQTFAQDAAKGAELYKQCIACHGPQADGLLQQKAPRISGQYDWYILKQLQDIKAASNRKNPVMVPILAKLTEQDMKDLAAYISKL